MMTAVAQNGMALQYATAELREELRGDHDVVMAAVGQDGTALEYATAELRGDREVVMKAAAQNGHNFQHATKEVSGDREVVMAAVAENGYAVQYASDELRGDQEVMEAAVAATSAHGYAPVGLQARLNTARPLCFCLCRRRMKAHQHLVSMRTSLQCVLKRGGGSPTFPCVWADFEMDLSLKGLEDVGLQSCSGDVAVGQVLQPNLEPRGQNSGRCAASVC